MGIVVFVWLFPTWLRCCRWGTLVEVSGTGGVLGLWEQLRKEEKEPKLTLTCLSWGLALPPPQVKCISDFVLELALDYRVPSILSYELHRYFQFVINTVVFLGWYFLCSRSLACLSLRLPLNILGLCFPRGLGSSFLEHLSWWYFKLECTTSSQGSLLVGWAWVFTCSIILSNIRASGKQTMSASFCRWENSTGKSSDFTK